MISFVLKHDRRIFRSLEEQIGEQCDPSELSKLNTYNSQKVLQTMSFDHFSLINNVANIIKNT